MVQVVLLLKAATLWGCHLQCLSADAKAANFTLELSLSSSAFATVTVQCEAARSLLSEYVSDFVGVSQLFAGHNRELALVSFSIERLIR